MVAKLQAMFGEDPKAEGLKSYAELLYGQALLAEGGALPDPVRFASLVTELMVR